MARVIRTAVLEANLNDDRIKAALQDAFNETNKSLELAFDKEFTRAKWNWPKSPSPRDIVDSGDLRRSYRPVPSTNYWDHKWTMDYAVAVHEGAKMENATLPARPWTRGPVSRLEKIYEAFAKTRLAAVQ